jgi:hypothetical protein
VKITTITLSRLRSYGSYDNVRFEATAVIDEGESEHDAADVLARFVDFQLDKLVDGQTQRDYTKNESQQLEWDLKDKKAELETLQEKATKVVEFLERHGVNGIRSELPF